MRKQYYPRHVLCPDGAIRIVPNREQHEAHVGYAVNEDGTPKSIYATPPTMEEILNAGYSQKAAESIFVREQAAAAAGLKAYGPNEEKAVDQTPANPVPPAPVEADESTAMVSPEFAAELEKSLETEIPVAAIAETVVSAEEKAREAMVETAAVTAPRRGRPRKVVPAPDDDPGSFA